MSQTNSVFHATNKFSDGVYKKKIRDRISNPKYCKKELVVIMYGKWTHKCID